MKAAAKRAHIYTHQPGSLGKQRARCVSYPTTSAGTENRVSGAAIGLEHKSPRPVFNKPYAVASHVNEKLGAPARQKEIKWK